jgi:N4-(beta-N-acetylglucosaminyl)-L-asparaginase
MTHRRKFLQQLATLSAAIPFLNVSKAMANHKEESAEPILGSGPQGVVISTWDAGMRANLIAWDILSKNGHALDAVEKGVKVTELENSCCVGLNGRPDREGHVTLDACIMDNKHRCGSVAFLQHIKHPISVARAVLEKTPHVLLVGEGALQFAKAQGFKIEKSGLSKDSKKDYVKWLKKSSYQPVINVESGEYNHDTIGMLALDFQKNISGSCTTSGMAYKMFGRVGDSPIIGAGLFVDNEVGAACASGVGEEVIRIAGAHLVVEFMRIGASPKEACKQAIERIVAKSPNSLQKVQVCFIAVDKLGRTGAFALQKGFVYTVSTEKGTVLEKSDYYFS